MMKHELITELNLHEPWNEKVTNFSCNIRLQDPRPLRERPLPN